MTRRELLLLGLAGAPLFFGRRVPGGKQGLSAGRSVFEELLMRAKENRWHDLEIGESMGEVGQHLIGTPYVEHTLETSDTVETCVVNLDGLDCVTFFESCLGFARMLKLGGTQPSDLVHQVAMTRYRDGRLDGYLSRLHYTSEWIDDNHRRKNVRDITADLPGAEPFVKKIDFMSTHPELYRQLKANPAWVSQIARVEKRLTQSKMWHVPKAKIADAEARLQTGDIVGITTSIAGIDCSHTGLCLRSPEGELRLLHASSTQKRVVLGPRLSQYLVASPKSLGVMIARPLDP